ncbi:MAG: methyltransferase, partial [Candidatus Thermoplasmatota archaeon]|nr:methyltransferase [Candidatus Thermoplasmatota archaeon]
MTAVLLVPRTKAQKARMELDSLGLVDRVLKIGEEGEWVLIPLTGTPPPDFAEKHCGRLEDRRLQAREVQKTPMEKIRERLFQLCSASESCHGPSPVFSMGMIPEKWEKLGDVICLRMPPGVDEKLVARAYAEVLGGKAVVDYGDIHGEYREPSARLVLGDSAITIHVENGIRYKLDALKIMFSSGNIDERIRMSTISMNEEVVVDMFAGIGYFTLPIAIHSGALRVEAYEKNPVSWGYLRENILLNGVEDVVSPHNMDNRECPEKIADRILMGYVGNT